MVRNRVRYFSDGVMIGGKDFVEEAFRGSRHRFGNQRKTGAGKFAGIWLLYCRASLFVRMGDLRIQSLLACLLGLVGFTPMRFHKFMMRGSI